MKSGKIRALAICILRKDGQILVFEGYDPVKQETFYRPLGGAIEFGEYGRQALVREMREEIGVEITTPRYLGLSENIFTYGGKPGHEIVLIYAADLVDRTIYEIESLVGQEDDGSPLTVAWKPLEFFQRGQAPLYPAGLLEFLLAGNAAADEPGQPISYSRR
jgi:8-oxo-dGTP pyrophosphatase MutT (NUDIX family)